ncbi:MAG: Chemotaxis protein methyltransferase CheR [Cyanobacteria bacterium RYN_339]|nr:Chemotaxis protein methyltransferase CheR [Cyanobacteria bacterium RYN_339]
MTLLDLAKLYNFSGGMTVLIVSLWLASRYQSAFFRPWLYAYVAGVGVLACELAPPALTSNMTFLVVQVALITTMSWMLVQTGVMMEGGRLRLRGYLAWLVGATLPAIPWLAMGKPFLVYFAPHVLAFSAIHVWLGWRLIRFDRRHANADNRFWLGWPMIVTGLWIFTYPVLTPTPYAWVGYLVSGLLNMLVGMGMALFVVEQTARDLRTSKDELVADVDRSNTFIHTMSHELRTPLNAIKTAAFLVARTDDSTLSAKQLELLDIVDGQAELLNRLVRDLVDYSRVESGLMTCELEAEDLAQLARQATQALEKDYAGKGIALMLEGAEAPIPIEADGARLHQVISNLLVNAKKFTPAGGQVTVRVGRRGGRAFVEVHDTGIGIAPAHHAQVFEKYFQVDGSTKRKVGGLGLGLAITKAIVEQGHGGTLRVESELGAGARFCVDLPLEAWEARELADQRV